MSDLLTHIRRFELVDVDLDKEPACEGELHPLNLGGHDGGAAAFIYIRPCCPTPVLVCRGRVDFLLSEPLLRCHRCAGIYSPAAARLIEL